nr:MAG TPA: hypothetical protein [Caudoviricetes sp.]
MLDIAVYPQVNSLFFPQILSVFGLVGAAGFDRLYINM